MVAPLLEVAGLRISIPTDDGLARILDHVDLTIPRGRIVGVVGESGCGKSTLVRAILGILPRSARVDAGRILFAGEDLLRVSAGDMTRRIRGKAIGFIPQDPFLALAMMGRDVEAGRHAGFGIHAVGDVAAHLEREDARDDRHGG